MRPLCRCWLRARRKPKRLNRGLCYHPYAALQAVIYDFTPGRRGQHARDFLSSWQGNLICDDYGGYKQGFSKGVTEIGCMAHARSKFVDLHVADKSQIAGRAVEYIRQLYEVEREGQSLIPET